MIQIKTINSQSQIQQDIIKTFKRNRVIDQMACYLGAGTDRYLNPIRASASGNKYNYPRIAKLLEDALSQKKDAKVAIVSLGCGSCEKDKIILEDLKKSGHDFSFFGIDSSMNMLYRASDVLNDATFEAHLICADFGASDFKKDLDKIIGKYDVGIYLFLGNTLGNLNQSYIADVLKNTLRTGDCLMIDISGFETITTSIQSKLFQQYKGYLHNPDDAAFCLGPLEDLGIPIDSGKLVLKTEEDDVTRAQVFTFGFKVNTSINFNLGGEESNLSPNEYIDLHHVLVYDLRELIKFLETKKFKIKDQLIGDFRNQLLLQKQ